MSERTPGLSGFAVGRPAPPRPLSQIPATPPPPPPQVAIMWGLQMALAEWARRTYVPNGTSAQDTETATNSGV